jgi:hypothetical protein
MDVEQLAEWELAAETEEVGENPPQCPFVHHKSYKNWLGIEPGDDLCQGPAYI